MLVIHNAKIYPQNPQQPAANALAIDDGHILAVGSSDEILNAFSTSNTFNANGLAVIPGLTDAHIHLEEYGLSLLKINCETTTLEECLQRVAERVIITPPGEWILGHGWNQNRWDEGYGTADMLDNIAPNHPVYLTHKSLHCGWANHAALHLAGINSSTPDPENGRIGRLENGEPDGILFEDAVGSVESILPEPSLDQSVGAIKAAQSNLWRLGLTGVHDFDRERCFSALQVIHQAGKLQLRVVKSIPLENLQYAIDVGLRTGFGDDMLHVGSVKLFSDGALGPHTAAMFDPYENEAENRGMLMLDSEKLFEYGKLASSHGISLAVHAIGDRANHEILNGYAKLREFETANNLSAGRPLRHRIEHVQIIQPGDISRFKALSIIASMQPIHATSDMLMADQFWGERARFAYAFKEQLKTGNTLIFGSDAPVESPNPFWGIHAAVTRRRADGTPSPQGWYPKQRLDVSEAIQAYTTGPAYAANMEGKLGRLAPGFLADLLILNLDPYSSPPDTLNEIRPLATMVAGDWVYLEM